MSIRAPEGYDGPLFKLEEDFVCRGVDFIGRGQGVALQSNGVRINMHNSSVNGFSVGIEARQGTRGRIKNSYLSNDIADMAYDQNVILSFVNTYAEALFNLAEGDISSVGRKMNRISHELIATTNPSRSAALLVDLANLLQDNKEKIRWASGNFKWMIAIKLVEEALGALLD